MEEAATSPEIMNFMDEAQQSHGEKSLIYVRFLALQVNFFAYSCIDIIWNGVLAFQIGQRLDVS